MAHLPEFNITFKQFADTVIERSARGIGFLIVKDSTASDAVTEINKNTFLKIKSKFTAENQKAIEDVLDTGIYKLFVVRMFADDVTLTKTLDLIKKTYSSGRITIVDGLAADFKALATWAKTQSNYHVLTYKTEKSDSIYVENFQTEKVVFKDDRGEQIGIKFLPTLLGILCTCNIERSSTYFKCNNLIYAEPVGADDNAVNTVIGKGNIVLINDNYNGVNSVRIGAGVNTLTTLTGELKEDHKYIDTVEVMDIIREDIIHAFKTDFVGKMKNSTDNQMLFLQAIKDYFRLLEKKDILEENYNNSVSIDLTAQREAWQTLDRTAIEWDDTKVKNMPFKRDIFLCGDIKINGAMENLSMIILMK